MFRFVRFNSFLTAALVLSLAAGCRTKHDDDAKKDKKDKKEATVMELHMEVDPDGTADNAMVTIGNSNATFEVNVEKDPFVDGADIEKADVVDDPDGLFSIRLKFNRKGGELLDTMTSFYPGKRIAIYCRFGAGKEHNRYIAAPTVTRPIASGIFEFAPSTTREEAKRIVRGLNDVAVQLKKDDTFP